MSVRKVSNLSVDGTLIYKSLLHQDTNSAKGCVLMRSSMQKDPFLLKVWI